LTALNPNADFRKEGTPIWVTSVEGPPITAKIARIVADKALKQVRAYDAENRLVVAYPATIGSEETPSPSGDHLVNAVAQDPVYYYDPQNFVQGGNLEKLQLPPGPNNPVGSVWIDLTDPGYGIHGTPDPTKIGKTASHGCIRLSNWDAEELAKLVEPGVVVSFTE
jgi:lipoprotein-anchoring transpeptidase ErfK/SrfK